MISLRNLRPSSSPFFQIRFAVALLAAVCVGHSAYAVSNTWSGSVGSTDWVTAANWSGTAPVSNVATFLSFTSANASSSTTLTNTLTSNAFIIGNITFDPGAPAYTMTGNTFRLNANGVAGNGIINNSGTLQTFNTPIFLGNNATVSGASVTINGLLTVFNASRTLTNNVNTGNTLTLGNIALSDAAIATRTLTISGSGNTLFSGTISNGAATTGNLTFNASHSGTATINGTNTYTGTSTLSAGTFVLGNNAAFGTSVLAMNGVTVSASGTRVLSNTTNLGGDNTFTGGNSIELGGTVTETDSRTITNNITSGTLKISGNVFLRNAETAASMTVNGSGATVISGNIANNNAGNTVASNLIYSGNGSLTLSGSNSFTGGTTVSSGTINLNSAFALGTTGTFSPSAGAVIDNTSGTSVTMANNSAWTLTNITYGGSNDLAFGTGNVNFTTNRTVTLNGSGRTLTIGGTLGNTAGNSPTLQVDGAGNTFALGGLSLTGTSVTNTQTTIAGSANVTVQGVVSDGFTPSGTGALVYSGSGTLRLNGVNTYKGSTTVSGQGGTLVLGSSSALGASSGVTVSATGATLDLNGQNYTTAIAVTSLAGRLTNSSTTAAVYAGDVALASTGIINGVGDITLNGNTSGNTFAVKSGTNTLTLGGTSNNTSLSLTLNQGTLILNKTNTTAIRNGLVVNGGLLQLAGTGGNQILNSAGVTLNGGTFDVNTRSETVATLQVGTGSTSGVIVGTTGTLASVADIDARNGSSSAILGGTAGLTKTTSGTVNLTAANTYTGATVVNQGTLLINGSGSSAVTVNSGGILGGSGTVGASVTINAGGVLAPGNSPGIISTGNLILSGSLSIQLGKAVSGSQPVAGTDYDQVNVTGSVDLTGSDLTLSILTGVEVGDYYFIVLNDDPDAVTGVFASLNGVPTTLTQGSLFTVSGQQFQISYTGSGFGGTPSLVGGNDVVLLAVPEPGTCALLGLGLATVLWRVGSRRRPNMNF